MKYKSYHDGTLFKIVCLTSYKKGSVINKHTLSLLKRLVVITYILTQLVLL